MKKLFLFISVIAMALFMASCSSSSPNASLIFRSPILMALLKVPSSLYISWNLKILFLQVRQGPSGFVHMQKALLLYI